ncbi:Uncharacterised protein [Neisseria meningitidis]|nr:Uncharacterised protein [Neisseria meningitidis]
MPYWFLLIHYTLQTVSAAKYRLNACGLFQAEYAAKLGKVFGKRVNRGL